MNQFLSTLIIAIIPLIFAITVHEAAHGWVASRCGDKTALFLGRVTLNPLKHIDLIGTVIMPIVMLLISPFVIGYAKPVPVNWKNLYNPRRDMALVAIAGPGANLIMALLWAGIAKLSLHFLHASPSYLYLMAIFGIHINILLMILNLLPIPPLDGSRVISSCLPERAAYLYNAIEPYGIWILIILLIAGILTTILFPPAMGVINWIKSLFKLPI